VSRTPDDWPVRYTAAEEAWMNRATPVTDFRVDTVEISEADYWKLPERARRLIETYATGGRLVSARPGVWSFEIAIYRWEEIQKELRALGPSHA